MKLWDYYRMFGMVPPGSEARGTQAREVYGIDMDVFGKCDPDE